MPVVDTMLFHKAETYGGSSGCPILRENNGDWIIVGLHCGTVQDPKRYHVYPNKATLIKAINEVVLGIKDHKESELCNYRTCRMVHTIPSLATNSDRV